jgi:hypothetical protein
MFGTGDASAFDAAFSERVLRAFAQEIQLDFICGRLSDKTVDLALLRE